MTPKAPRRIVFVLILAAASAIGAVPTAAADEHEGATLDLDPGVVAAGHAVQITGTGWPSLRPVSVQVCGNAGRRGSADCDFQYAVTVTADENGRIRASLVARIPPEPCPCAVLAASIDTTSEAVAPLTIVGAPIARRGQETIESTEESGVAIDRVAVTGGSAWRASLGLPVERQLVVTLRNESGNPVEDLHLAATVGRGDFPRTIGSLPVGSLRSGERRTIRIPFTLDALSTGRYEVTVRTLGPHGGAEANTRVSTTPWMLYAIAVIFTVLVVWRATVRVVRRRRAATSELERLRTEVWGEEDREHEVAQT